MAQGSVDSAAIIARVKSDVATIIQKVFPPKNLYRSGFSTLSNDEIRNRDQLFNEAENQVFTLFDSIESCTDESFSHMFKPQQCCANMSPVRYLIHRLLTTTTTSPLGHYSREELPSLLASIAGFLVEGSVSDAALGFYCSGGRGINDTTVSGYLTLKSELYSLSSRLATLAGVPVRDNDAVDIYDEIEIGCNSFCVSKVDADGTCASVATACLFDFEYYETMAQFRRLHDLTERITAFHAAVVCAKKEDLIDPSLLGGTHLLETTNPIIDVNTYWNIEIFQYRALCERAVLIVCEPSDNDDNSAAGVVNSQLVTSAVANGYAPRKVCFVRFSSSHFDPMYLKGYESKDQLLSEPLVMCQLLTMQWFNTQSKTLMLQLFFC